jgi:predicted DNA-binding transcriptional regulator AlpA
LETRKQTRDALAPAAPALGDALVDYNYVATQLFIPNRGRQIGITRNGLDLMIERKAFPKPIRLGKGPKAAVRWRLSDLRKWLEARAAA